MSGAVGSVRRDLERDPKLAQVVFRCIYMYDFQSQNSVLIIYGNLRPRSVKNSFKVVGSSML